MTVTVNDADASPSTPAPAVTTHRPARAAAMALGVTLLLLTVVLGYVDGTGLFAPENWVDAGLLPTYATSPAWATTSSTPVYTVLASADTSTTLDQLAQNAQRLGAPGTIARSAP